jgi:hypothetical protein
MSGANTNPNPSGEDTYIDDVETQRGKRRLHDRHDEVNTDDDEVSNEVSNEVRNEVKNEVKNEVSSDVGHNLAMDGSMANTPPHPVLPDQDHDIDEGAEEDETHSESAIRPTVLVTEDAMKIIRNQNRRLAATQAINSKLARSALATIQQKRNLELQVHTSEMEKNSLKASISMLESEKESLRQQIQWQKEEFDAKVATMPADEVYPYEYDDDDSNVPFETMLQLLGSASLDDDGMLDVLSSEVLDEAEVIGLDIMARWQSGLLTKANCILELQGQGLHRLAEHIQSCYRAT